MTIECDFAIKHKGFELHFKKTLSSDGITAICGKSGSGKTTLLRLMAGLEKLENATFVVNQQIFQDGQFFIPTEQRNIGYVGQSTQLFPFMTVRQNIQFAQKRAYYSHYTKPDIDEFIDIFGVTHCLKKKIAQLSTGETQRIKIIQAIANQPSLLLFDEVLSAIDSEQKNAILTYLQTCFTNWKLPVIIVSHDETEIELMADEVVRI